MFIGSGSQVSLPALLIATTLLAPSLKETAANLRFLAREGGCAPTVKL